MFSTNYIQLVRVYDTQGTVPVSVAVSNSGNLVYVLNSGGDGSIIGFSLSSSCTLSPISGSTKTFGLLTSGAPIPAPFVLTPSEVVFTPDDSFIIAIVKGPGGFIWTFPINPNTGVISGDGKKNKSNGFSPFSFDFDTNGHLLVTEAFGTAGSSPPPPTPNTGALTSYNILPDGTLQVISGSVGNQQTATCWVKHAGTNCAFTSNNVAGFISSYSVSPAGSLTLSALILSPVDLAIDGNRLHIASTGFDFQNGVVAQQPAIYTYTIQSDRSLTDPVGVTAGLPTPNEDIFGIMGIALN